MSSDTSDVPSDVLEALDRLAGVFPARAPLSSDGIAPPPPRRQVEVLPPEDRAQPYNSTILNVDRGEQLAHLTNKALTRVEEILSLPLDQGSENFPKVLSAVRETAAATLSLAARVDENRFRKKNVEALQGLLAAVLTREQALGVKVIAG